MSTLRQMPLRVPGELHDDLKIEAKRRGMSLNQYCLYLLSRYTPKAKSELTERGEELLQFIAQAQFLQKNLGQSSGKRQNPIFSLKRRLKNIYEKN